MKNNQNEIKLANIDGKDILVIPASSSLESIFQNPHTPVYLKDILKKVCWQFRVEFTPEKSLLSPNLVPTWNTALLAWGVEVVFPNQEKTSPMNEYLQRTGFHPNRFNALRIPVNLPGRVWGVSQVSRTQSDKPIVFVTAVLDIRDQVIQESRIALAGVWHEHVRLAESAKEMVGKKLSEGLIEEISKNVKAETNPVEDFLGSILYRKEMAQLLTSRALSTCFAEGVK